MKKYLILLSVLIGNLSAVAAKSYDIIGIFHQAETTIPANNKVITTDERIAYVSMVLIPAVIREKSYDVTATRVAENVYKIEGSTFHAELYVEVSSCNQKADRKAATMIIDNTKETVKGKLIFK